MLHTCYVQLMSFVNAALAFGAYYVIANMLDDGGGSRHTMRTETLQLDLLVQGIEYQTGDADANGQEYGDNGWPVNQRPAAFRTDDTPQDTLIKLEGEPNLWSGTTAQMPVLRQELMNMIKEG